MHSAEFWINQLKLEAHPEGGFYKETYRSPELITLRGLPERFGGDRCFSTAIYFLLRSQDRSLFHRIKSDEMWHYYAGSSLNIYMLADGEIVVKKLGPDLSAGDSLQILVPASCWFGAKVTQPDSYTLSGCTVAPGFDFADFEMADARSLLRKFPNHSSIIEMLT